MRKLATLLALTAATPAFAASGPFFSLGNTNFIVLLSFLLFIAILVYFKVPGMLGKELDKRADGIRTRIDKDAPVVHNQENAGFMAEHPVVRTHPESGRKSLFVNRGHTVNFVGMSEEESLPILNYLFEHQVRNEFTCRFRWRPGSLALWDNRAALHYPLNDYHGHRREMHRITLRGDKPK